MAAKNIVLFIIILFRNIAPLLACTPAGDPSTTTTTATSTTTTAVCTATITADRTLFTGFTANCTNNECTFVEGETFTMPANTCALRGVDRPFLIDGTLLPGTETAPTAVTTVTCTGGVLSATGGVTDPAVSIIACSEECVLGLNLAGGGNPGIVVQLGNCAANTENSGATECLIDNNGTPVEIADDGANGIGGLCGTNAETDHLVLTDSNGDSFPVPANGGVAAAGQDLTITCTTAGTITAVGDSAGTPVTVTDVIGVSCV